MSNTNLVGFANLANSASSGRDQRKKAVDFVFNNSRLEGFVYEDSEIEQLYQDYINGYISAKELGNRTRAIMAERQAEAMVV
ncbi:MAG: antitoxin VbhA family protein [Deferribacteraceae bacterium]|jgi:hypothetical protein|nr:antitoxin VbhA family protein [Deferribacteraceae bacterium]